MENQNKIDTSHNEKIKSHWNTTHGSWYANTVEFSAFQSLTTCATMTEMWKADRTLEVGCGPGRHSIMLASSFLKNGGVLVASDFSKDMV